MEGLQVLTVENSQEAGVKTPVSEVNPWLDEANSTNSSASTSHTASPSSHTGGVAQNAKVSRISSISSVTSSTSSASGTAASTIAGDELKPIRLMKRQQERRRSMNGSTTTIASGNNSGLNINNPSSSSAPLNNPLALGISIASPPSSVASFGRSLLGQTVKSPTVEEFQCRPIRLGSNGRNRVSLALSAKNDSTSDLSSTSSEINSNPTPIPNPPLQTTTTTAAAVKRRSIQIKNLPQQTSRETAPLQNLHRNLADDDGDMIFAMCLVDFHHQRGPEVQWWKSNYHPQYDELLFQNLPFQALPDGSHLFEETFSNFNLVYDFKLKSSIDDLKDLNSFKGDPRDLKTLFGCSCVRQVKTSDLSQEERDRNQEITRSIVQKAIVIIARKQPIFTKIKEKLSIITKSYFQQDDLQNFEVLENLFENLNTNFKLDSSMDTLSVTSVTHNSIHSLKLENTKENELEDEYFVNLNLKQSILKFKQDFLRIFKCLLLHKKVIIFSNTNLEMLTQFQNNLISLFPNLINNLDNSGCPLSDYIETNGPLEKPNSLNTSNRKSMLRFFGLPLQIFNTKNAFWNPYLPLQQLDELSVESFMIGCSNLLFLNQAEAYKIDLVVNLDTGELSYPNGGKPEELSLSHCDKKFINNLINSMNDGRKDEFIGNDDYIRYQFEDYLSSLVATVRFAQYIEKFNQPPPGFDPQISAVDAVVNAHSQSGNANHNSSLPHGIGDLSLFNKKFVDSWRLSNNYKIWNAMADEFIFNFIDPKHLGVDISDTSQTYKNISNFFSSFKFKPAESTELVSHEDSTSKAQKFIPDDDETAVDITASSVKSPKTISDNSVQDTLGEEFEHVSEKDVQSPVNKLASWTASWGFKRK